MKAFIQELLHAGLYKRTQGRITRQVTWAAIVAVGGMGLWRLNTTLITSLDAGGRLGIVLALALLLLWVAYRLVNLPQFADFLIAVEAEMNKVSWPTRAELIRASLVVLVVIGVLAAVLFGFDAFWTLVFKTLRII